jgi:hypothetical protein
MAVVTAERYEPQIDAAEAAARLELMTAAIARVLEGP